MGKFSEAARERELFQYYRPVEDSDSNNDGRNITASSSDPALMAFAQLGAVRLNATRCIISLVGSHSEFVLAESSETFLLQHDTRHNAMMHIPRGERMKKARSKVCSILIGLLAGPSKDQVPYVAINNINEDDRFKDVAGELRTQALVCLPLRSARGFVIGLYCVLDNKPRKAVSDAEIRFLEEMAATAMNHIEAGRVKQRHDRAEKMVKALALYLEGKESLRDWWLNQAADGRSIQQSTINEKTRRGYTLDQQADAALGVQDGPDRFPATKFEDLEGTPRRFHARSNSGRPSPSPSSSGYKQEFMDRAGEKSSNEETTIPSKPFTRVSQQLSGSVNSSVPTEATTAETDATEPQPHLDFRSSERDQNILPGKELQEALLTVDVKHSFSRASNLLREAIDLDGVAFYDASIGSFGGGSTLKGMNQKAPGAHTLESITETTSSGSDTTQDPRDKLERAMSHNSSHAGVLGYSTRSRSSLKNHADSECLGPFSDLLLRTLAKRYPHGKIFNFDDEGSISSSDIEGRLGQSGNDPESEAGSNVELKPSEKSQEAKARKARKMLSREAESAALLQVIPGVRSVAWFPLWDSASERWYAGALVWSSRPTRVLCVEDELTYMAAWSNSIMAEVSRLAAIVSAQVKVDFVSSISHELRSPLHGILASVELLSEEENIPPMQIDMINTINSCGKTLLDTINHVLDFAKINRKKKAKKSKRRADKLNGIFPRERSEAAAMAELDTSDLRNLTEEVIDSVYAGKTFTTSSVANAMNHKSVVVIVDISWRPNWKFKISTGVFRRVLMNLFSNALKYTNVGFVKVEVSVGDAQAVQDGKSHPAALQLVVSDSGRGISRTFLRDHLYTAFKQEDALSVGTGLGLSIVRQLVLDEHGTIDIESELGSGTKAIVAIPVPQSSSELSDEMVDTISKVRTEMKGRSALTMSEGFNIYPNISDEPTGILSPESQAMIYLKSSVESLFTDWFGMDIISSSNHEQRKADVLLLMASEDFEHKIELMKQVDSDGKESPIVIALCDPSYRGHDFTTNKGHCVFYLRLPATPKKLANLLYEAFCSTRPKPGLNASAPMALPNRPHDVPSPTEPILPPAIQGIIPVIRKSSRPPAARKKSSQVVPPRLPAEDTIDNPPRECPLSPKTYKALLVEDNFINLRLLTMYMDKLQQDYETATNGLEAVNAYKNAPVDIVFMDLHMPVMDGLEATREMRKYESQNGLPPAAIVALTGAASLSSKQEAFSSGVDLFLTKPVAMKVLKEVLLELRDHGRTSLREFVS